MAEIDKFSYLPEADRAIYDSFVTEYLKDFDTFKACLRLGYRADQALNFSRKFIIEPYVQFIVSSRLRDVELANSDTDVQNERDKNTVMAALRDVVNNGDVGERISAAKVLSDILGMKAPIRTENKTQMQQSVMIVPATQSIDDWERSAMEQQEKLINGAS